jgi:hypothetical protein
VVEGLPVRTVSSEIDNILNQKENTEPVETEIVESNTKALSSTLFRSMIVPEKLL